ncbi:MAG: hypothetical protein J0L85_06965 [Zoogloea sp.]|nr:hypothetical protein [Zoogloea sp.]MCA0187639.1 hypothetical protein [Pseudomonadota bacterium]
MLRSSMLHSLSRIASACACPAQATAHFLSNDTSLRRYAAHPDRKFFSIKNRYLLQKAGKFHIFSGHLAQRSLK